MAIESYDNATVAVAAHNSKVNVWNTVNDIVTDTNATWVQAVSGSAITWQDKSSFHSVPTS